MTIPRGFRRGYGPHVVQERPVPLSPPLTGTLAGLFVLLLHQPWIAVGLLAAGAVFGTGAALLIAGATRRRTSQATTA